LNPVAEFCTARSAASNGQRLVACLSRYVSARTEICGGRSSESEKSRGCRIQPRLVMPPLMPDMGVKQTDYRPIGCGGTNNAADVAAVCGCAFAWKVRWYSSQVTARIDGADVMYALYHTVHTTITSHRDLGGLSIFRGTRAQGVASGKVPGLLDHLPGPSPLAKN
jgi:hypothetical protein